MSQLFDAPPSRRVGLILLLAIAVLLATASLLSPAAVNADPGHDAGDYLMFAKAAGDGDTSDPEAYEPVCDDSNDKQSDISGSNSHFYGRIHSNADLAISGSDNRFLDTSSPNPELTFGVNDGPSSPCQLQAEAENLYASGAPLNITGNGNGGDVHGPYGIGANGWPGNLSSYLDTNGMTFGNDVTQVLPGEVCDVGSLTNSGDIEITAADNGKVVCNGDDDIVISVSGLGSASMPFRITMISHGLIDISGSDLYLAPAAHGVLAWTDQMYSDEATSIKIAGDNVNVLSRAILFTPRSGQDVSGSNSELLCIQMIGQGALKVAGSNSILGPLASGCGDSAPPPPPLTHRMFLPVTIR
jgi:hypothetical protein